MSVRSQINQWLWVHRGEQFQGSLGRPEVLGKQAAMETRFRENTVVAAVVVLADSHTFPKQLAREFLRST